MAALDMPETTKKELQPCRSGVGPLVERNYWAELDGVRCSPEEIAARVRREFETFAPAETAVFRREGSEPGRPLEVGDELDIHIALLGHCGVRVVHVGDRSLTLHTLKGHPESGRITFGAYVDEQNRTVFRIRSRTRANGLVNFVGYHVMGRQLQARCWINFVGNVAGACGGNVSDYVHVRTCNSKETPVDGEGAEPTFDCQAPPRAEESR